MRTNQVNLRRRSITEVGRIPEIHKKTTSTGTTFGANRHATGKPIQVNLAATSSLIIWRW